MHIESRPSRTLSQTEQNLMNALKSGEEPHIQRAALELLTGSNKSAANSSSPVITVRDIEQIGIGIPIEEVLKARSLMGELMTWARCIREGDREGLQGKRDPLTIVNELKELPHAGELIGDDLRDLFIDASYNDWDRLRALHAFVSVQSPEKILDSLSDAYANSCADDHEFAMNYLSEIERSGRTIDPVQAAQLLSRLLVSDADNPKENTHQLVSLVAHQAASVRVQDPKIIEKLFSMAMGSGDTADIALVILDKIDPASSGDALQTLAIKRFRAMRASKVNLGEKSEMK